MVFEYCVTNSIWIAVYFTSRYTLAMLYKID